MDHIINIVSNQVQYFYFKNKKEPHKALKFTGSMIFSVVTQMEDNTEYLFL